MNQNPLWLTIAILLLCAVGIPLTLLFPPAALLGNGLAVVTSILLLGFLWRNRDIPNQPDNLHDSKQSLIIDNSEPKPEPSSPNFAEMEQVKEESNKINAELNQQKEENKRLKTDSQQQIEKFQLLQTDMARVTRENDFLKSENDKLLDEINVLKNKINEQTNEQTAVLPNDWLKLVRECVELFDDLERHKPEFDEARFELADHISFQLRESLERCGVEVIADETVFDRNRHKPLGTITTKVPGGAGISETVSPGFAVGRNILRRATVRLEK